MAKKATAKPAAKRKPRNTIVDDAPQIAELAKRMEAERGRIIAEIAAEEEAKKKPATPNVIAELVTPLTDVSPEMLKRLQDVLDSKEPAKSSSPWRRFKLVGAAVGGLVVSFGGGVWSAGGWQIGPGPLPADSVSAVFDTQESAFRSLSGERAKALRSGEIKTEADSAAWMSSRFIPQAEAAWIVLLTEEAKAFGGEQWTAEKEAGHIERYAR